ncbi:MAG: helix-turn-helix domain-containing protein [Hyphomicrobiales bacterium]
MLRTRIRELRKARRLTLKQLAARAGTTPQTIQRLETDNMTVSTDWLERLANALEVAPLDLVEDESRQAIPMLGELGSDGLSPAAADAPAFRFEFAALDPVAVRLRENMGPYRSGSVLVAERMRGPDHASAHERDCLAALDSGAILLRRVAAGRDGGLTLVPLGSGDAIDYDVRVAWLARLVMEVRAL